MNLAVIITGSFDGPRIVPERQPGMALLAAVDVEWSKNYRIKNGNIPFCYSVVWLTVPAAHAAATQDAPGFGYISAYVDTAAETPDLVVEADTALAAVLDHADLLAGHQLCSDLAVLAQAAAAPPQAAVAVRQAWQQRRAGAGPPRVIDTRYDAGHLLTGISRRLVDVCAELGLDVTQPELRGTSMTALHRRWLELGDTAARERISVLNLRHALSTALIAARAAEMGGWPPGLNVNQMLAAGLGDAFAWLADPVFTALLASPDAA